MPHSCSSAQQANFSGEAHKTIVFCGVVLMGCAGYFLLATGTAFPSQLVSAGAVSVRAPVTSATSSVWAAPTRKSLSAASVAGSPQIQLDADVSLQQETATHSPFRLAAVGSLTVAFAWALLTWARSSRRQPLLQPMYMEFGEQQEVAMFYATGQRTQGRTPTAVYNLFDRVGRLVRSNVTWVVNQLEDPEKVIEQAVQDMQGDLVKIRQSYSEVLASQKRAEVKQKQVMENVMQWQKRAELALVKGEEDLAREALRRKNAEQKSLDGINAQLAQTGPVAENLLNSMKLLEQKLDEAKANKAQLIARAKSAQTTKKVNDMLTGLDTGSAMAAFERMEDKVESLEAQADVSGLLAEGTTLDKQFKSLEGTSAVDDELAAMKRQLQGPKPTETAYLPPSDEDAEIERIRKQLRSM